MRRIFRGLTIAGVEGPQGPEPHVTCGGPARLARSPLPMPGCASVWIVHKLSIVAATLPPKGGTPEVCQIETTEKSIRRFIDRLGGPAGPAVCYEAGPGGFALWRLLSGLGVACDVVAPSLGPGARWRSREDRPA
jgi:hypothetical protein